MSRGLAAEVLRAWEQLLRDVDAHEDESLPGDVTRAASVLRDGASPELIEALERRLGTRLPPSYRDFLLRSDGAWAQPGWGTTRDSGLGLLDCAQVGWFRDRDRSYVDIWGDGFADDPYAAPDSERRYLDHERSGEEHKHGHLLYALQISSDIDGYTILLNPLVVDQEGEWEAWDFGHKVQGGTRHRSFAALIAHDSADLRRRLAAPRLGLDPAAVTPAFDPSIATPARAQALRTVWRHLGAGLQSVRTDLIRLGADRTGDLGLRQDALRLLAHDPGAEGWPLLIEAVSDPEPRIRSAVLSAVAANPDPEARRVVVGLLLNPDEPDFVRQSIHSAGADAVFDAWAISGDVRLLAQLANFGDPRSVPVMTEAIADPELPLGDLSQLIRYAWWPQDPAVVPALVTAGTRPDAPLTALGIALVRLGAVAEAIELLGRALGAHDTPAAAQELGWLDHPAATAALVDRCRVAPTEELVQALGWGRSQAAVDVLLATAEDAGLRGDVLAALEKSPAPGSGDALAVLAGRGDVSAIRALARRRDERARPHLLRLVAGPDQLRAAAGLRDLRDPTTAGLLLDLVRSSLDPDVRACATHALLSQQASETGPALLLLAADSDPDVRRLADLWLRDE